jgi:RNA polymerase sigma-70 factor (ECF subfamily)
LELLTGTTSRNDLTLADLYDQYEEKMLRYARILVGDPSWAEDLVQDTFMRAIAHLSMLGRLEPYQRLSWLRRVLKNRFIDQQRAYQREQEMITQIIQETELDEFDEVPMLTRELLELASDKDRELLKQHYFQGLTSQEIGRQQGIPAATVRSRLHLARKRLRARQKFQDFGNLRDRDSV